MGKRTARQKAIDYADEWFSKYIRKYHSDKQGLCTCYTCGVKIPWHQGRRMNCGHFQSRGKLSTRWHPDNARPQCVRCNKYRSGEQLTFYFNLNKEKKGLGDDITYLSNQMRKYSVTEIREIGDRYKNLFERLL